MNKTLTAPNCLIYIIQQTCFKPHYFNSLIQFYCIHKQVRAQLREAFKCRVERERVGETSGNGN